MFILITECIIEFLCGILCVNYQGMYGYFALQSQIFKISRLYSHSARRLTTIAHAGIRIF